MVRLSGLAQTEPTPTNTSPQDSDAMFGHLSISDDGLLLVGYPMWDLRAKVEISPEGRTKRGQLLQRVGALPAGPARNDVFVNVQAALAHIPDQFASYAIDVGFYFFGLPDWKAKQAEIDRVVDEFFDPADIKANPAIALVATQLKAVGFLRYGPTLDMFVQHMCQDVHAEQLGENGAFLIPVKQGYQTIRKVVERRNDPALKTSIQTLCQWTLLSTKRAARQRLQAAIETILTRQDATATVSGLVAAFQNTPLPTPNRNAALREAVLQVAGDAKLGASAAAQAAIAAMKTRIEIDDEHLVRTSVEAVARGQALGEFTETSRRVLASLRAARQAADQSDMDTLIRLTKENAERSAAIALTVSATGSNPAEDERAALQRLSLSQLLRWINGPVVGPRRQRLDRRAALAHAATRPTTADLPREPRAPRPPARPAPAVTAHDIDAIAAQGYAAAASFFLQDVRDMQPVAQSLNLPEAFTQQLTQLATELERLHTTLDRRPGNLDEGRIQQQLSDADTALEALRTELARHQTQARLRDDFDTALFAALGREALRLDRTDGGIVNCRLQAADWAWVADRYHRRWLNQVRRVWRGDHSVELQADEALALHVTGSSRSSEGYVFCVSVHLWQRDGGKTSLPSDGGGALPAMNTADWYDTYRTCCVLHVLRG